MMGMPNKTQMVKVKTHLATEYWDHEFSGMTQHPGFYPTVDKSFFTDYKHFKEKMSKDIDTGKEDTGKKYQLHTELSSHLGESLS